LNRLVLPDHDLGDAGHGAQFAREPVDSLGVRRIDGGTDRLLAGGFVGADGGKFQVGDTGCIEKSTEHGIEVAGQKVQNQHESSSPRTNVLA